MAKLVLYSKDKCHLCDKMKSVIESLRTEVSFHLAEKDITSDEILFEKYRDKIPVLEIDGRMFAKYTVDPEKLRRKLSRLNKASQV